MTKHVLIAVPLFIFTGMVMLRGGAAARLVHFATTLVGHWPGGLGLAMILAMGFFAAFCGSILAAITAVGRIMIPKMVEQGYPKPFVIVLAASAAFLEALIHRLTQRSFQRADRCASVAHICRGFRAGHCFAGSFVHRCHMALPQSAQS